jgi:hypothetical protein
MSYKEEQPNIFTNIILIFIMAILYNTTGLISATLLSSSNIAISIFIPEGIALAGILIYGNKILPGIFLGQLLLAQFEWSISLASIFISIINTAGAYLGYKLFFGFKLNKTLRNPKDIIGLILLSVLILQPLTAIINNYILYLSNIIDAKELWLHTISWWAGNSIGQILITPMLLLIYAYKQILTSRYIIFAIVAPLLYNYILQQYFHITNIITLLSLTLPISIYISIKNLTYATILVSSLSIGYVYMLHQAKHILLYQISINNLLITINVFVLSHILLTLLVGMYAKIKRYS